MVLGLVPLLWRRPFRFVFDDDDVCFVRPGGLARLEGALSSSASSSLLVLLSPTLYSRLPRLETL